jgi:hypothetical protein
MRGRLLKASDIQGQDDPARKLAEQREKAIRDAITVMLSGLATLFIGDAVLKMISRLDSQGLSSLLKSDQANNLLVNGYQPVADTFLAAARQAANDNLKGLIPYDPLAAAAALQSLRDELGANVDAGANSVIRMLLLDSLRTSTDPGTVAERLRQVIGLDVQSAKAVANYRRLLQTGDSTALRRALRDQRYDDLVRAAVRGNVRMTPDLIEKMVAGYADRMLAHRADRMAATEAMQAAVSGIRDAHLQAVNSGRLFDSEVKRFWLTAGDELVCPVCSSVPLLNETGVGVNDSYRSINGQINAPLAHPWCRCSERYVADVSRLTEQPFRLAA